MSYVRGALGTATLEAIKSGIEIIKISLDAQVERFGGGGKSGGKGGRKASSPRQA